MKEIIFVDIERYCICHSDSYNIKKMACRTIILLLRGRVSNQPIPFPMDRDGHDFHALFQYMFLTWV